jgi:hypothetical protein
MKPIRKIIFVLIALFATANIFAQTEATPTPAAVFETKCDALCQKQKELETRKMELEKSMREVEREVAQLELTTLEQTRIVFQMEDENVEKAKNEIDYQAELCRAQCTKTANDAKALIISKYKAKWEATFPQQVIKRCSDRCPSAK